MDVCNVALGAAGRRGLPESGEAGGLGRVGTGRGGSRGVLGLVWGFGSGGDAAGDGRRRCTPAACGGGRRWAQMRRGRGTNASWRRLSGYSRVGGHGRGRRGLGGGRLGGSSPALHGGGGAGRGLLRLGGKTRPINGRDDLQLRARGCRGRRVAPHRDRRA
jgi:hypothetical protein